MTLLAYQMTNYYFVLLIDHRRLWSRLTFDEIWFGAFAFCLYGCGKWWFRNVEIIRYQRLWTWWCKVLFGKARQHRLPRLSCTWTILTILLLSYTNWSSVLFIFGFILWRIQLLIFFATKQSKQNIIPQAFY